MLILDGDGIRQPQLFAGTDVKLRLEAFLEMLEARR